MAFFLTGVASLFTAASVHLLGVEPRRPAQREAACVVEREAARKKGPKLWRLRQLTLGLRLRCRHVFQAAFSRTFFVLLLQGVCGYIPLHAFQFYTLYFQSVGMPDWQASLLTACPLVGGLLGSLFGGWLGDQAERWSVSHGRPLVGQCGTLLAIPLIYFALLAIPRRPEFFGVYAVDMLFLGE